MGFPTEPRLERRRLCRERFTLDKWNQLAGYSAPPRAPPMVSPPMPTPEATSAAPLTTPTIPPITPTTSEPSITISASEFRAFVHTFQTLTTTLAALFQQMAEMCAHQDQQTAMLYQIQQHLGLLPPPQPDVPASSEPLAPVEDTIPPEDTTTV